MEIKIEGNPGSGNHYTEVKIGHIENNFPNVKEVTIIKGSDSGTSQVKTSSDAPDVAQNNEGKRAEILRYAETTLPYVLLSWKGKYMDMWNDILDLPEVAAVIYKPKRQKGTSFNRYELCHIINYLGEHVMNGYGVFEHYNGTQIANGFGDGAASTTRPQLYYQPEPNIRAAIDKLLIDKNYYGCKD